MNRTVELLTQGQSCWMDDLTRRMIRSGDLTRRVTEEGLRGITSNPAIFEKAVAEGADHDQDIAHAAAAGRSPAGIYEELISADVRDACDILRPVYEESDGVDGFVSLEVSPHLAHNTEASIEEARRLWKLVGRPNLFIKIPGTPAGVPAIEQLLFEGINVNITLLFSIARYEAVAEAYLRALERRLEAGRSINRIASVASFFLSRIDVLVDRLLRQRIVPDRPPSDPDPRSLLGRVAIANAKLAYRAFGHILESNRWIALAEKGARVQRMLWASTSTKSPNYPDLMYVEPLIGAMTINTMPRKTIAAFRDHGTVGATVTRGMPDAERVMADLERTGVRFDLVAAELENDAVQKFIDPYDKLLNQIAAKGDRAMAFRDLNDLQTEARRLRRLVIRMTTEAGSGHPTSCMSCADIVAALFFREMRWDPNDAAARNVDTFVLSKGHAAPILWAALHEAGAISEDPLSLRRIDSTLEGHPTPLNPWVRIATGSLGQGLAAANGLAVANRLDHIDARVFCLLGDGECSEGSVWEAAQFASLNGLANVTAIVDVNGIGQSEAAPYHHDSSVFARRFASFGWRLIEIDGHDMAAILAAFRAAHDGGGPTAILARTIKGKGVSFLEGADGWHGKPLDRRQMSEALDELGDAGPAPAVEARRVGQVAGPQPAATAPSAPAYRLGDKVATRVAFGHALEKLGAANPAVVALDGDVKNSTGVGAFAAQYPDRFFESFIAEQNMVGVAVGLAAAGKVPYASTFACFLTRAYDFIRMAQYSRPAHLVLCGSHAGVSIGEDGPSQMGLEDLAMFRALMESTVLYPADAVSAERLTTTAADANGIVYIRTTRPKTPVIYPNTEEFPIGGSKVLRASPHDRLTVVAAGITVHEALAAYDMLSGRGIPIRVIDAYSVKPLDDDTVSTAARDTGGLIVVEDHAVDGGLGDAVTVAVGAIAPVYRLGISQLPRSGPGPALLDRFGISRSAIEQRVLQLAA